MIGHLALMSFRVRKRTQQPFFFTCEKNEANRAARLESRLHDGLSSAKSGGRPATIISRAGWEIPGIEMATEDDDLPRILRATNFADHVGGRNGPVADAILHVDFQAHRFAAIDV